MATNRNNLLTLEIVNTIINKSPVLMRELGGELTAENISRLAAMPYEALNEFVGAIMKITRSYAYTTIFDRANNPFAMFFREKLEAGFTVEDLYVKLFDGHDFDYEGNNALKRFKPNVESFYYSINFEKEYDISVSLEQSRTAFLTLTGIEQFMASQYQSMYSSAERDIWKQCLEIPSTVYLNGDYVSEGTAALDSDADIKDFLEKLKNKISEFQFLGSANNPLKTDIITRPEDVLVILPAWVANKIDVQTLSGAFNLDKIEIKNQIISVPSDSGFGGLMSSRSTLAVIVDRNFFRIFPQTFDALSQLNGSGFFTDTHLLSRWIFSYGRFYNIARIYDQETALFTVTGKLKNITAGAPGGLNLTPDGPYAEGANIKATLPYVVSVNNNVVPTENNIKVYLEYADGSRKNVDFTVGSEAAGAYPISANFDMVAANVILVVERVE